MYAQHRKSHFFPKNIMEKIHQILTVVKLSLDSKIRVDFNLFFVYE